MWHAHEGMGWWMLFSGLLWLLFIGTLTWLVLSLLASGARRDREERRVDDALEVARRRYAAGEITREEFLQIRDDLQS